MGATCHSARPYTEDNGKTVIPVVDREYGLTTFTDYEATDKQIQYRRRG